MSKRVVVAITGASGVIYGIRLLEVLQEIAETHLVMSRSAGITLKLENPEWTIERVESLASFTHRHGDIAASLASGSFPVDAMTIVPCSMKTLAAIAHGYSDNLITRCADVCLKERRRLIVVPRETPLHNVHLKNMLTISEMGGIIVPPMPGFYHQPKTMQDLIDHVVGKIVDLCGFEQKLFPIWRGPNDPATKSDLSPPPNRKTLSEPSDQLG